MTIKLTTEEEVRRATLGDPLAAFSRLYTKGILRWDRYADEGVKVLQAGLGELEVSLIQCGLALGHHDRFSFMVAAFIGDEYMELLDLSIGREQAERLGWPAGKPFLVTKPKDAR